MVLAGATEGNISSLPQTGRPLPIQPREFVSPAEGGGMRSGENRRVNESTHFVVGGGGEKERRKMGRRRGRLRPSSPRLAFQGLISAKSLKAEGDPPIPFV